MRSSAWPRSTSIRCPAPKRCAGPADRRQRLLRGNRAVLGLRPARGRCRSCRKGRPASPRSIAAGPGAGSRRSRRSRAGRSSFWCSTRWRSSLLPDAMNWRSWATSRSPQVITRRPAGRRGRRGRSPGSRPRALLGRIEVGDEAHVRLVDAHAEGDGRRRSRSAVLAQEALLVRAPDVRRPARRGTAAPRSRARAGAAAVSSVLRRDRQ